MSRLRRSRSPLTKTQRGFTLVEILVVVAIIVILMAILIPVAMQTIYKARNAAIGVELSQLKTAMMDYKKEHGDFPPSMDWDPSFAANAGAQQAKWFASGAVTPYAYSSICERHLLRCYPKATDKVKFYRFIAPYLDQDEALVFWLYMIANDPREPFKNFAFNSGNGNIYYAGGNTITQLVFTDFPGSYTRFTHYEFDTRRLVDSDGDGIPGYQALYSRETTYMYFDSRSYMFSQYPGYLARGVAQPMADGNKIKNLSAAQLQNANLQMFVNPNSFQILCAGQDGDFGYPTNIAPSGNFSWGLSKQFPQMLNTNEEDSDNLADFTEGRMLIDHRAP